jgi:hypothetical protein
VTRNARRPRPISRPTFAVLLIAATVFRSQRATASSSSLPRRIGRRTIFEGNEPAGAALGRV